MSYLPSATALPLALVHRLSSANPMPSTSPIKRPTTGSSSTSPFRSRPASASAPASPERGARMSGETASSARYVKACARNSIMPEPAFVKALREPNEHHGAYSTYSAEERITPDGLKAMVQALDGMRGLHTLALVGLRRGDAPLFTHDLLGQLVKAVRVNGAIHTLDLSDNALDDALAAGHLAALLAHNAHMTTLRVRSNAFKEKAGRQLLEALASNRHLHALDMACNHGLLSWKEQAAEVTRMLRENTQLVSLCVSLPEAGVPQVLQHLQQQPKRLPSLRLVHHKLGEPIMLKLKHLLGSANAGITELDLTHAYCEEHGAIALAQALLSNVSMTRLNLSHNGIAAAGAVALADALKVNCCLTDISVAANHVNDAAAVAFAEMLTTNEVLTSLDLGRNCFGATGAQALRQALLNNKTLMHLGALETLSIGVGLRSSLQWYCRNNRQWFERMAAEMQPKSRHHEGLLRLLPATERALREKVYDLEDSVAIANEQSEQLDHENYQVNRLLDVTVKRNAELVDSLSTLQARVEQLSRNKGDKKKKTVPKKKKKTDAPEA